MIALDLLIILLLIGVNGLLAMSELAMVSSRALRLEQKARDGQHGASVALSLLQDPNRFLSTVQIGITLVGIVSGAFGGARMAGHLSPLFASLGAGDRLADSLGLITAVGGITYLSLVFGEIVPKRVALHSPETVASLVASPMRTLSLVGAPFVTVLSFSTAFVLRVLRLAKSPNELITMDEIRMLIGQGSKAGTLDAIEARLLDRVFHFGDRHVHEVMTPRTEAVGIERGASLRDFFDVYMQRPHSRFPVYDSSPDKVVGILGIKDVLSALSRHGLQAESRIEPLVRPAVFVPESKLIDDLFRELQASGNQMAIAVDEFGGTAGIVTLEQLLEEMVGRVRDELDLGQLEVVTIDEQTFDVDGVLSVEEARSELGLDIPEGPYDTIAGYLLDRLGHIPRVGEYVDVPGFRLTVREMTNRKIEHLIVQRRAVAAQSQLHTG